MNFIHHKQYEYYSGLKKSLPLTHSPLHQPQLCFELGKEEFAPQKPNKIHKITITIIISGGIKDNIELPAL